jgi:hypothetical protein
MREIYQEMRTTALTVPFSYFENVKMSVSKREQKQLAFSKALTKTRLLASFNYLIIHSMVVNKLAIELAHF